MRCVVFLMNRVKELRESIGISQKELAIEMNVAQPTVSEWEKQKKDPSGERLAKLAKFFGVSERVVKAIEPRPQELKEDADLWKLREEVRRDPDRQMLFDLARSASIEDVRRTIAVLDALKKTGQK